MAESPEAKPYPVWWPIALPFGDLPRSLRWSVLFYLAHLFCLGWIASSEIFLGLAVLCAFGAISEGELSVRFHQLYFPLAVYLVASTLSAFLHAATPLKAIGQLGEWFTFLSFPLGMTLYRTIPGLAERAVRMFAALALFISGYGFIQFFFLGYGRGLLDKRITGPTAHVMTLSGILLPLALLFLVLSFSRREWWIWAAAAATTAVLVLTFTRNAWLGWLVGFILVITRRRLSLLQWAVPVLVLAITFSPLPFFARLVSSFDVRQSSNLDRIRMAQAGMEMIRDYPLMGVGPSQVKEVYPIYRFHDAPRFRIPHLHNNIIQLWAERGVLAATAYILLLAFFLRVCFAARRRTGPERDYGDAGIAITVSLAFAGLFEFNFGDTEVLLTMLNLYALCCAVIERRGAAEVFPWSGLHRRMETPGSLFSPPTG